LWITEEVFDVVQEINQFHKENAKKKEEFYRLVQRIGLQKLKLICSVK
jgi:dissimilatory sulfite reductase (desulfoviridin) alpha/beta subunit